MIQLTPQMRLLVAVVVLPRFSRQLS